MLLKNQIYNKDQKLLVVELALKSLGKFPKLKNELLLRAYESFP